MKAESSIFLLPEFKIGPYRMQVRPAVFAPEKRDRVSYEWDQHLLLIDADLPQERQLPWLMRSLVRAIHYRSGLIDVLDEEAYTHSLATGLVELSQQGHFWAEFNALLAQELQPRAHWGYIAAGCERPPVSAPKRIVCRKQVCTFTELSARDMAANQVYAWYNWETKPPRIELAPSMKGANFCVIVLHETLHFLHHQWGLRKRSITPAAFKRAQAMALLDFLRHNPKFWTWWLQQAAAREE